MKNKPKRIKRRLTQKQLQRLLHSDDPYAWPGKYISEELQNDSLIESRIVDYIEYLLRDGQEFHAIETIRDILIDNIDITKERR